jgi:hypothetical protein
MDQEDILAILERAEGMAMSKTNRLLITLVFMVVTVCCQGG